LSTLSTIPTLRELLLINPDVPIQEDRFDQYGVFTHVEFLTISLDSFNEKKANALWKSFPSLKKLVLNITDEDFADDGFKRLSQFKNLKTVHIDLTGTKIRNTTLKEIAQLPFLKAFSAPSIQLQAQDLTLLMRNSSLKKLALENVPTPELTEIMANGRAPLQVFEFRGIGDLCNMRKIPDPVSIQNLEMIPTLERFRDMIAKITHIF
jgi:hypothetical protein